MKALPRKKSSGQQVMTPEDVTAYLEGVKELQEEEKKEKPRKKTVRKLMKATYIGRRDWIVKDAPPVPWRPSPS